MKMRPFDVAFIFWLAALAGCATITFKRGASPDAMAADERACHAASTGDAGYVECMRSRGWMVSGTNAAPDPIAVPTPGAEPNAPVVTSPPTSHDPTAVPVPATAVAPGTALAPSARPAVPAALPASDPLAHVEVGSWWKLGGTAGGLESAINACVDKLGDGHRPNSGATIVTVGLRDCLRAAGWHPFDASRVH